MFFTAASLFFLIFTIPISLFSDGLETQGCIIAIAGLSLGVVTRQLRQNELNFFVSLVRPFLLIAAIPALWMIAQLLPLKNVGIANSIWESAAAALGRPTLGSISIDIGATLIALARYLSAVAIGLSCAAVAIDRSKAQQILFWLSMANSLAALLNLISDSIGIQITHDSQAATDCAILGLIATIALSIQILEQRERLSSAARLRHLMSCLFAIVVCGWALKAEPHSHLPAFLCAIVMFVAIGIIRRFNLRSWGQAAIVSIIIVAASTFIASGFAHQRFDATLMFAAPSSQIGLTQRMLNDTNWFGTGAGTYLAVSLFYRDSNETITQFAPTAAAQIAIEMGRTFLWLMTASMAIFSLILVRGALKRGRDSIYPALAASGILYIVVLSFGSVGALHTAMLINAATLIGIGVAQYKSHSSIFRQRL